MIRYVLSTDREAEEISRFIASLNWQPEYHIAYCGTVQEEILASIGELWETADTPFVLAYEQDQLVGLLGLDADLEDKRAELWGPFVRHEKWQYVADQLWQKLYQTYADRLETYSVFYNKRNTLVSEWAERQKFRLHGEHVQLIMRRIEQDEVVRAPELAAAEEEAFKQLHTNAFPDTYYSAEDILQRRNVQRKVLVYREGEQFAGYVYVEASPAFAEASIEFFAVEPQFRGRGIGEKLLRVATSWVFSFPELDEITLCVGAENKVAILLYERVGFVREHDLLHASRTFR